MSKDFYKDVAHDYRKAGWKGVLPIPYEAKGEPPNGWTGASAGWPDSKQIQAWTRGKLKEGNVALRMPENVIGIDVDHGYKGKTGLDTLAALESKWGKLPPTFTSGSRAEGGIRYFRVPEGMDFPGGAGKDIDIIQFRHRYAMVWPSIHPEGNQYVWRDKDNELIDYVPGPADFPELPRAWVQGLDKGSFSLSPEKDLSNAQTEVWLEHLRDANQACEGVEGTLAEAIEDLGGQVGSRHDATLKHVWALLGQGANGHAGVREALQTLRVAYVEAVGADRKGGAQEADHDFQDMVFRGVRKRATSFPEPVDRCACDSIAGTARGQLRFALRLAGRAKGEIMFVHSLGWMYWNGKQWVKDNLGIPMRTLLKVMEECKEEARSLPPIPAANLWQDVRSCEGSNQLKGILEIAKNLPELAHTVDELDADPLLFNTDNGILDLSSGQLMEHDPSKFMTKLARGGVDKYQTGPTFTKFIEEILPDKTVRDYIQRLLGYALLGKVEAHVLPIFTGTGSNGKSTLLEAVMFAFGDYAMPTDPALLIDKGQSHPTNQADLFGLRLAVTSETNEGEKLAASTVKRLTGGDMIKARYMRQDFFSFKPSHTIVMVTNYKPEVSGDDSAMWRRITVVPFDVVIPPERIDTSIGMKLEAEATAILTWAAEGYAEYVKQGGLNPPEAVKLRTADYRSETDTVARFIQESTYLSDDEMSTTGEVYNAYCDWCRSQGEEWLPKSKFKQSLDRHNMAEGRTAKGRFYHKAGDPKARLVVGEPKESPVSEANLPEPKATAPAASTQVNPQVKSTPSPERVTPLDQPVTPVVPLSYERTIAF